MCKRNTEDPLVKKFLDDYGINLLRVPRANARCGDLYVKDGKTVSAPADLATLLDSPLDLPEPLCEDMADLAGTLSRKVSFGVGFGLLEAFLAVLGAAGVLDKLKAKLEHRRDGGISFAFRQVTRESINPGTLGERFIGKHLREHPLISDTSELYVVGAVAKTPSIAVALVDDRSNGLEVDVDALHAASADADIQVTREDNGQLVYSGSKPLAIGVELYRLEFEPQLRMFPAPKAEVLRGRPAEPERVLLAEDDEALLALSAEE